MDSPIGKLMEAIMESVDESYSRTPTPEVIRCMRQAASPEFGSNAVSLAWTVECSHKTGSKRSLGGESTRWLTES